MPAHLDEKIPGSPFKSSTKNPESSAIQIRLVFLEKYLDTNSLFHLLVINNFNFKILDDYQNCIISIKDTNIDMITDIKQYLNNDHILWEYE